jgi:hypothetical protein
MIWLWLYVGISVWTMIVMALSLAWEDYDVRYIHTYRQSTAKFGYNYSRKGLWWIFIGACAPGINLLALTFFMWARTVSGLEQRKSNREKCP